MTETVPHVSRSPQLAINAEQKLEIERLRRELDSTRAELARANSILQSREVVRMVYGNSQSFSHQTLVVNGSCLAPQSGTHLSSTVAGLQAERDVLLRSVREQEAELNALRQQAQLHLSSLEQERQRSSVELGSLHAQLQEKVLYWFGTMWRSGDVVTDQLMRV